MTRAVIFWGILTIIAATIKEFLAWFISGRIAPVICLLCVVPHPEFKTDG